MTLARYARLSRGRQLAAGQLAFLDTLARERQRASDTAARLAGPDIQCWQCRRYFHPAQIQPHPETGAELCDLHRANPDHERQYDAWIARQIARLEAEAG